MEEQAAGFEIVTHLSPTQPKLDNGDLIFRTGHQLATHHLYNN